MHRYFLLPSSLKCFSEFRTQYLRVRENMYDSRDSNLCRGPYTHTGKCIRRFAGIYAYCRYFIDRKWLIFVSILYRKACHMPKGL